ncbi:thioredoxin domain-containing protein [Microbacterium keratanolyticum]|uniref:thioredoxin domain-containing protein n=1 Tax=Microbacterium keratanolyticum TaxID=67574 RepID=UPI0036384D9B
MTNRLADTLSPYLRAHADNPVDWYPWGEEAFAEAQRRDVPLLISIGYSTCHWCHVMARESFADPVTAAAINAGFVAVKVDREEHPDVDSAFMAAASAFTQNLGWPLTVFATPAGRAFYAGTYWPPVARASLPAFRDVLAAVREAWTVRRAAAEESADAVADVLRSAAASAPSDLPTAAQLADAARTIAAREDSTFGGFGGAPKFPVATTLRFLQAPLVRREAPDAAASAARALAAMASSELRDEIDGGFFRYATQRDWSVPHYERMLIDNAQLLDVARDERDTPTARGIASFLLAVLPRAGGGFGAAQDSESWIDGERSEGGYYARGAAARALLDAPAVDGKVITGWNGLAIAALARAGAALSEPGWIAAATTAAQAVLRDNTVSGVLMRASLDGHAGDAPATPADHGQFAEALFELAVATGDAQWAVTARALLDEALARAAVGAEEMSLVVDPVLQSQGIVASPDVSDGDLPSGLSSLASAALAAWRLGAGERYRDASAHLVRQHADAAQKQPFAHGALLRIAAALVDPPRQIVVVTDHPNAPLAQAARDADADVATIVSPAQARGFADAGFELFDGKDARAGLAYDCRAFVCRLPVGDPAQLPPSREGRST